MSTNADVQAQPFTADGTMRMGKISIPRELERRFEHDGWTVLFVHIEGATSTENVVADIAKAALLYLSVISCIARGVMPGIVIQFE